MKNRCDRAPFIGGGPGFPDFPGSSSVNLVHMYLAF